MQAKDAVEIIQLFRGTRYRGLCGRRLGVDALLGCQTRAHKDLDIAVPHRYVPRLRELFTSRGYREKNGPDNWECNFVLADGDGHELDVHTYELDEQGNNIYGVEYRREHLTGKGSIDGYPVRCICAEWLVKFHSGYRLDDDDYRDVKALCERFAIPLPEEFRRFFG